MALQIGRRGQLYATQEAAYGVSERLAVTNALRHIDVGFGYDPFARVTSPEKKHSPGPVSRFDRQQTAELGTLVGLLRPSGALGTLAECDPVLEAAFGSRTIRTADSTVSASSTPTTTTATVADAGDLAAGDMVLIEVTGQAGPFVRKLTVVSTNALTWEPALPAAPATGDSVKGAVTYTLTSQLAVSLTIAHYLDHITRELLGVGINSLELAFDANEEPRFTASGPAATQRTGTAQAQPAGFTTVGGHPPSGLTGQLLVNGTAYLCKSLSVSLANALAVRNQEYGVSTASELYRQGRREISLSLEAFAENEAALYDLAEAGSTPSLLLQTGNAPGNIVCVYAPKIDLMVPDQDDPDEEVTWSFEALAIETADGRNDELTLGLA